MKGYCDIHGHYIPQIDDGADNMEMAKDMLKMAWDEGIRTIIVTPHYREHYFLVPAQQQNEGFERLKKAIEEMGLEIQLFRGNEVHYHKDMIQWIQEGKVQTMAGSNYVLTEFSSTNSYNYIRNGIYELVSAGYRPIIAHVERYDRICGNIEKVCELINLGAYIQVNSYSFYERVGDKRRRFCRELMKKNLIHFIGSDAHNTNFRSPQMLKCVQILDKKMGRDYVNRILKENPMKILQNDEI